MTLPTSTSAEFAPHIVGLEREKNLIKGKKQSVHVVPDKLIKLPASHAVAVNPAQLKSFGSCEKTKNPCKTVNWLWEVDNLANAFEVVRGEAQGTYELFLRMVAAPEFVATAADKKLDDGDRSRLRQIPDALLVRIKQLVASNDIELQSGQMSAMTKILDLVDESDGPTENARINIASLPVVEKMGHIVSMSTLAPTRDTVKRGREEAMADINQLSSLVKMTKLPGGKMAFSFTGIGNLFVAGDVVVGQAE